MKILRKAQIEVSFNWIFILIAGGLILLFFIMLARNHEKTSTNESSNVIAIKLQTLFAAIQQNPDAVQKQDNIKAELEFSCNEEGQTFVIKGSTAKKYLDSEVLFTPKVVGDSKTIAWTQLYSSPYPVVQVLYFTDEKTQYIFESSAKKYYEKFPEQFERNLSSKGDINSLTDQGFRKYIIVTGSSVTLDLENSAFKKKSTIIQINEGEGKIDFIYDGDYGESVSVPYVNDVTLFGAIISGDDKLYGCTMESIMNLSRIVGKINLNRAGLISTDLAAGNNEKCDLFYNPEGPRLPQLYIDAIIGNSTYAANGNYDDLKTSIGNLQGINEPMARSNCPTIY
jgi:hypothetical protein